VGLPEARRAMSQRECRPRRGLLPKVPDPVPTVRWRAVFIETAGVTRAAVAPVAINAAMDGGIPAARVEPVPASSRGEPVVVAARRAAIHPSRWSPLNLQHRLRRRVRVVATPMAETFAIRDVHRATSVVMARGKRGVAVAPAPAPTLGASEAASDQANTSLQG